MENFLRRALEKEELLVHYQPQIDIRSGKITCAEALVRWRHAEFGLLDAKRFIPAAEEIGFIKTIDEWVLRTACAQLKTWQNQGLLPICIAVNLSAREFENPGLVDSVARTLERTGLAPEFLELEITESAAMGDIDKSVARLNEMTAMGIHISIDDFGTGYSSLSYLKSLPIQRLKIDQSFVRDITVDPDDRTIIQAVTALAHSMKMKVVAEGVETGEQLAFLRSEHCDEAQGYYFHEPLPPDKFRELIGPRS
jgi:EAL domain-containing protein (putative c-di-GMP-specific phosphodiesterase class I)